MHIASALSFDGVTMSNASHMLCCIILSAGNFVSHFVICRTFGYATVYYDHHITRLSQGIRRIEVQVH